jgi:hypothetical protein
MEAGLTRTIMFTNANTVSLTNEGLKIVSLLIEMKELLEIMVPVKEFKCEIRKEKYNSECI